MGDRLIYRDTFDQALADLTGGATPAAVASAQVTATPAGLQSVPSLAERLHRLRDHAEQLTRELESLEKETVKK